MSSREGMTAAIRPVTMTATVSATAVATRRFCSTRNSADPLPGEVAQHPDELIDDDRRKALRRLVHDDELRVHQERAGDGEHLLLAAGELRRRRSCRRSARRGNVS